MKYTLHTGDNRDILKTIPDNSIDSVVTDPPYELGFMGKHWDNTGIAYNAAVWNECLRVLKPGGHLIAFGGSRTYHRLAVAIEDAGFEIRDQIQWIYGSGFPKSLNVSKALDKRAGTAPISPNAGKYRAGSQGSAPTHGTGWGNEPVTPFDWEPVTDNAQQWHGWGTALKPAHEPAVLARKPLIGAVADNVMTWGVGALNIDGCRIDGAPWHRTDNGIGDPGMWAWKGQQHYAEQHPAGRWPANVILDEEAAQVLDAQSGGASRFFYVAKASKAEREAGLDGMEARNNMRVNAPRENEEEKFASPRANHHPTVKPVELMRYLVRLVTPKGGTVLDPFMGSGSTGCAAMLEGVDFVGIDITPEYVEIARRRILHYANQNPMGL